MGDPPDYPPPPDQPPAGYEAVPTTPPPAAYSPPADYGAPTSGRAQPPERYRVSHNVWMVIAAVIVVVVLLVGVIGYVFAGYAYASIRISDASNAINAVDAHRGYVNTTFDLLDQQISSFETMSDSRLGKSTSGRVVTESQSISTSAGSNDHALAAARSRLSEQQWLTAMSRGRLAAEAGRIDHARNAVATLRSGAGDYVQLGQFFQSLFQSLIDWGTMLADVSNNDFLGAASADTTLKADVTAALQVTNAPGLPQQYRDFLIALQAYATDVGSEFNARTKPAQDAAVKLIDADLTKLGAVDFTGTSAKIKSYYQHYRDDFNSEMDKAIA